MPVVHKVLRYIVLHIWNGDIDGKKAMPARYKDIFVSYYALESYVTLLGASPRQHQAYTSVSSAQHESAATFQWKDPKPPSCDSLKD